ncbi:hypothetical protein Srot_1421 [Segniliparus rotundus DSM 44985]|uniref:Uncharacterized protein n=1 Tax=Segniliparus rotundus (strain ATCC BAA-972 / CDC 1076 / CIP 108378 / DSM 44985 / JCM 13578) TaxID=640132 RepID=D6Z7F5_SEGRD|nr:hypothetical protein [Segniliparus rotundus]ADG97387.1 hypothetical protein Srot_0910 [Segniliparus rotundus DSM 44985]ADG97885.1 hypothetical protein Srot_1421 [Segniliparus rotundus DSM 44985]
MARDIWTQDVRQFNIPDDDDEPATVPQLVRQGGQTLSHEQAEQELARQREIFEAEDRRRADEAEQARLQRLVDSGEAVLIDVDAHRSEKRRIQQLNQESNS